MKKHHLIFGLILLMTLFLSSNASSEENYTVSVNPDWEYWEKVNCRLVTSENGTYEECDWVTGSTNKLHEANITNPDWIISAP